MRICIAGAGAIGCTLAARLVASGQPVNVLARGLTLQQLQQEGVCLTDLDGQHRGRVNASDSAAKLGLQDLILVCTKAQALAAVLEQIQPMIHADTVIIPVVNGIPWWYFQSIESRFAGDRVNAVDPDGQLQKLIPAHHLIGCVIFITAASEAPGVVKATNPHLMVLGEIDHQLTPRVEKIRQLMHKSGIETRATDNIRDQIWTKVAANLTSNPLSVLTRSTLAQLYADPRLNPLVREVFNEVLLTAAAHGARIRFDPQTFMEMGAGMGAVRTSMLQDFEHGRPLELAAIGDAVIELAAKADLQMNTTRSLLALTEFVAEQRSAKNTVFAGARNT